MRNRIKRTHTVWFHGCMYSVPEGYKDQARELWGQSKEKGNYSGATTFANYVRAFVLSVIDNGQAINFDKIATPDVQHDIAQRFGSKTFDIRNPPRGLIDYIIEWYSPDHGYTWGESFAPTQFDREWGEDRVISSIKWWADIASASREFLNAMITIRPLPPLRSEPNEMVA